MGRYETVSILEVSEDPDSARKHGERAIESITASLIRFGQQRPIVVDAGGVIVAGNGVYLAMVGLGCTSIDVVRTDLRGEELAAYAIADNQTSRPPSWSDNQPATQE